MDCRFLTVAKFSKSYSTGGVGPITDETKVHLRKYQSLIRVINELWSRNAAKEHVKKHASRCDSPADMSGATACVAIVPIFNCVSSWVRRPGLAIRNLISNETSTPFKVEVERRTAASGFKSAGLGEKQNEHTRKNLKTTSMSVTELSTSCVRLLVPSCPQVVNELYKEACKTVV